MWDKSLEDMVKDWFAHWKHVLYAGLGGFGAGAVLVWVF